VSWRRLGFAAPAYRTITRRLPLYAKESWRDILARACAVHAGLGPATLVLYDVTTLYFETDQGDGFREPGYSKERRLEPQITVGLLTDAAGFPLLVNAFEGNKAETATIVPVLQAFQNLHGLADITVVADAGMISDANMKAIEAAGLSFILGARIPKLPYVIDTWRKANPDTEFSDGQIWTQSWPAGPTDKRRDQIHYYQWKADRARRTLRGIDEQVAKAEQAVAGKTAIKRNRFVSLDGGTRAVNRDLEAKARSLAGLKGYVTNLTHAPDGTAVTAEFVLATYPRLLQVEKSFRMSKHDLQARPIYHHKRESIEAHLNIVFAALAVTRWIEDTTGWSIKRFVRTARRYRTITIQAGQHTITAADPLPEDLHDALTKINQRERAH
jgi:transposase